MGVRAWCYWIPVGAVSAADLEVLFLLAALCRTSLALSGNAVEAALLVSLLACAVLAARELDSAESKYEPRLWTQLLRCSVAASALGLTLLLLGVPPLLPWRRSPTPQSPLSNKHAMRASRAASPQTAASCSMLLAAAATLLAALSNAGGGIDSPFRTTAHSAPPPPPLPPTSDAWPTLPATLAIVLCLAAVPALHAVLTLMPRSFTLGEAAIVSQAWVFVTFCALADVLSPTAGGGTAAATSAAAAAASEALALWSPAAWRLPPRLFMYLGDPHGSSDSSHKEVGRFVLRLVAWVSLLALSTYGTLSGGGSRSSHSSSSSSSATHESAFAASPSPKATPPPHAAHSRLPAPSPAQPPPPRVAAAVLTGLRRAAGAACMCALGVLIVDLALWVLLVFVPHAAGRRLGALLYWALLLSAGLPLLLLLLQTTAASERPSHQPSLQPSHQPSQQQQQQPAEAEHLTSPRAAGANAGRLAATAQGCGACDGAPGVVAVAAAAAAGTSPQASGAALHHRGRAAAGSSCGAGGVGGGGGGDSGSGGGGADKGAGSGQSGGHSTRRPTPSALKRFLSGARRWRAPHVPHIIVRKGYHVLALALFLPVEAHDPAMLQVSLAIALALLVAAEMLRCGQLLPPIGPAIQRWMEGFVDGRDAGPVYVTHVALLLGMAAPLWLRDHTGGTGGTGGTADVLASSGAAWDDRGAAELRGRLLGLSGLIVLGLGDTAASVVGRLFGRRHLWGGSGKTAEGTAANAAAMLLGWVVLLLVGAGAGTGAGSAGLGLMGWVYLGAVTVGAAGLEAATLQLDNLVVPVLYAAMVVLVPLQ